MTDIIACIECGSCVAKCSHGVYDKSKALVPVVVNPNGCVDHCHGCGNICPTAAISYVGEDTDWVPPVLQIKGGMPDTAPKGCCCCK